MGLAAPPMAIRCVAIGLSALVALPTPFAAILPLIVERVARAALVQLLQSQRLDHRLHRQQRLKGLSKLSV